MSESFLSPVIVGLNRLLPLDPLRQPPPEKVHASIQEADGEANACKGEQEFCGEYQAARL
jgi:hypothetical protein